MEAEEGRGGRKRKGKEAGDRRGPLRSGRAIKVFAHERVEEAKEAGERRACKKEKSKGRGKSPHAGVRSASTRLSTRPKSTQSGAARRADVPRSMIDRYDWGPSNLQLVARHVRIITQHASVLSSSSSSSSPSSLTLFSLYPLKDAHSRLRRLGSFAPLARPLWTSWRSYYEPIKNIVRQRDDRKNE